METETIDRRETSQIHLQPEVNLIPDPAIKWHNLRNDSCLFLVLLQFN